MALPLISDLALIMDVDEFATSVTYDGGKISGIFDNETIPIDNGGFVTVHQEQPRLTCKTSDVPSIGEGEIMLISGTNYVVRAWIHDGTGVTAVQLEKA
jgi:hypothetical protein